MTDYKSIADRLVELGIGERLDGDWYQVERLIGPVGRPIQKRPVRAVVFCHDWRVAGACMERMQGDRYSTVGMGYFWAPADKKWVVITPAEESRHALWNEGEGVENESLPLAIILAYLEATE